MEYWGQDYLAKRIEKNQKFLLRLLNINAFGYNPIRKWLGIDYKGKIDEISHLSFAYNTEYFKKGNQWYKRQTRVYQQPDLGYKLNLILERIPEIIIPKVGQPSWGLLQMRLLSNATVTYQPSVADGHIVNNNTGNGTSIYFCVGYNENNTLYRGLVKWDLTDRASNTTFVDATISLNDAGYSAYAYGCTITVYRSTQPNWTESATWNTYDGTNAWSSPGGDFTSTNSVSTVCTARGEAPPTSYWMNFTSAQNLISDCFTYQNRYVALEIRLPNNESGNLAYQWITSRENSYVTLRPKLVVTYFTPVTTYTTAALTTILQLHNAITNQSTTALTTNLEPNIWSKETINTTIWTKEPTHDDLYYE